MFVALKSVKYGLISLVPNLIPLGLGFGIWGFFQWDINFGMTTIVSMSIGIIVDDTVHFLSKYLRARREFGLSPEEGVRYVFASVGKAMWVTSFILVAGFSIMNLSEGAYNSNMGTLVSMIIIAALVGDFLLLPPILLIADKKRWR
jgi:predicted RND superfamily exporter protein